MQQLLRKTGTSRPLLRADFSLHPSKSWRHNWPFIEFFLPYRTDTELVGSVVLCQLSLWPRRAEPFQCYLPSLASARKWLYAQYGPKCLEYATLGHLHLPPSITKQFELSSGSRPAGAIYSVKTGARLSPSEARSVAPLLKGNKASRVPAASVLPIPGLVDTVSGRKGAPGCPRAERNARRGHEQVLAQNNLKATAAAAATSQEVPQPLAGTKRKRSGGATGTSAVVHRCLSAT